MGKGCFQLIKNIAVLLLLVNGLAYADNTPKLIFISTYLDNSILPIAYRDQDGFHVSFFGTDSNGQYIPFSGYSVGKQLRLYCAGEFDGYAVVQSINLTLGEYGNPDHAEVSFTAHKDDKVCIVTNFALPKSQRFKSYPLTPVEIKKMNELIKPTLEKNGVKESVIGNVLTSCKHQSVRKLGSDQEYVISSCAFASHEKEEGGYALLTIAEKNNFGVYETAYWSGYQADPYAMSEDFEEPQPDYLVDYADLDGDSVPELIISSSSGYGLLTRAHGIWRNEGWIVHGYNF
jgi:hypothetical protein